MEYDRTIFFPSNKNEKVRNCPGRELIVRSAGKTKRSVFESGVCCVMLANLRISGSADVEAAAAPATGDFVPAGISARAPGTVSLPGRRTISVSRLKHTAAINPSVLPPGRLGGA